MDVAKRARVSTSVVSLIERGHLDLVSVPAFRRVAGVPEVRAEVALTLPHGELDRLLNAGHAALHEALARHLRGLPGWIHAPEVSFAIYGERGVIDILAFHTATGSLLVIELKTELVSLENLLSTMDVRMRHAVAIARERGWVANTVSASIVLSDTDTNRRRVKAHQAALRSVFAADGRVMRGWLRNPTGAVRALSFWAYSRAATAGEVGPRGRRVRVRAGGDEPAQTAA